MNNMPDLSFVKDGAKVKSKIIKGVFTVEGEPFRANFGWSCHLSDHPLAEPCSNLMPYEPSTTEKITELLTDNKHLITRFKNSLQTDIGTVSEKRQVDACILLLLENIQTVMGVE